MINPKREGEGRKGLDRATSFLYSEHTAWNAFVPLISHTSKKVSRSALKYLFIRARLAVVLRANHLQEQ
jgi:hypothetical protein